MSGNPISSKGVFLEQAEQFATVVEALLLNEGTRVALAKEPLATLKTYGIEFKDPATAKRVESQLSAGIGSVSQPDPDHPFPRTAPLCLTIVAEWDREDAITVDPARVNAFVTRAEVNYKVTALEKKVNALEAALSMKLR